MIRFGKMETFAKVSLHNSTSVYVLQEDIFEAGHFLAALENAVVSFSPSGDMTVLAGSPTEEGFNNAPGSQARFSTVQGLYQLNNGTVMISDHGNHCIRLLTRVSNSLSTVSGKCTHPGHKDGDLETAMFATPTDLEPMEPTGNRIAVVEFYGRVRYILMRERMVMTASADKIATRLTHLFKNPSFFFISVKYGIVEVVNGAGTLLTGSGEPGYSDGAFQDASYLDPQGMAMVNSSILLLADCRLNKIRVLNMDSKRVTSICSGQRGYKDGDEVTCQLSLPYSVLVKNQTLYIGEANVDGGGIRRISFEGGQRNFFANNKLRHTCTPISLTV